MTSSNDKSTSFRWEIKDFHNQWHNNKNKDMISDSFNMGSVNFALFYNTTSIYLFSENSYGIILKDLGNNQSLDVNLKLWFENERGQKFYNHSIGKHTFNNTEDRCKFNVQIVGNHWNLFYNVYESHKTLYICCEVTDLNYQATVLKPTVLKPTVPVTDCTQQFLQNAWSMYEQGKYDAVIRVGKTEFKILKAFFMVQSEVFDRMFSSAFKEGKTSTIDVKDVDEHTMKQMVKWMYTCQIDDQGSVEDLFEAADKYDIKLLKTSCLEIMIKTFNNSNAFSRLILAVAHNDKQLKDAALKYIEKMPNNDAVIYLVSPEWVEFGQKKSAIADQVRKAILKKLKK